MAINQCSDGLDDGHTRDPFVQYYWQLNQQFSMCVNSMESVLNTNWKYFLSLNNDLVCEKLQYRSNIAMCAEKAPILSHFFFLSNVVISSETECLTGTDPIGGLETAFFLTAPNLRFLSWVY